MSSLERLDGVPLRGDIVGTKQDETPEFYVVHMNDTELEQVFSKDIAQTSQESALKAKELNSQTPMTE